jgi:transcriptional regulator with GAF, ATPase, and Fis domain
LLRAEVVTGVFEARAPDSHQLNRYLSREEDEDTGCELLGRSSAMENLRRLIHKVARTQATVLIAGESGTGKELVARALNRESPRAHEPFIKVNCAAIPQNLIESEFFGHEKGAFTGALSRCEGRFELAHGGTILLDEVSEISLHVQAKLLRVLQEQVLERLGGNRTIKVDVRVLATTNRRLEESVQRNEFQQDLFFHLSVFPIHVPPLRDRKGDLPLLAQQFAQRFSRKHGVKVHGLSAECMNGLERHDWPGNVRELQNVIERAVITARDGRLNLDRALPETAKEMSAEAALSAKTPKRVRTAKELEELERANLVAALEATAWRVAGETGAAQLLGMKPTTLSSRIKALGIERPHIVFSHEISLPRVTRSRS